MAILTVRTLSAGLMVCAVAFSLGLLASEVPAGGKRNLLLVLNWHLWLLFVISYPFAVAGSGFVSGIVPPYARAHRRWSPVRFWVGAVATTLFWIAVFAMITVYSVMAWYRGA